MARRNTPKKQKTVFILGAGFSMPAGIPPQANLLNEILGNKDKDLKSHRNRLFGFINDVFGLSRKGAGGLDLEDIYTPIHQSITRNESLKGHSPAELKKLETSLNILIKEYY